MYLNKEQHYHSFEFWQKFDTFKTNEGYFVSEELNSPA